MKFELPALPYALDALEPTIGKATVECHYQKHHNGYMQKLKAAIEGSPEANKSLEEIICTSEGPVFNNAAQVWNHSFYWNSMKPQGGGEPSGDLLDAINRDFGSTAEFTKAFAEAAKGQFGSGWAWLALSNGKLEIVTTSNAATPLTEDKKPLLTIDVWEHAYYLDYKNERPKYVDSFMENLINWEFALENLKGA